MPPADENPTGVGSRLKSTKIAVGPNRGANRTTDVCGTRTSLNKDTLPNANSQESNARLPIPSTMEFDLVL